MSSPGNSSRTAHDEVLTSGGGGGGEASNSATPKLHDSDMSRNLSKNDSQRRSTSGQHHSTARRMPRALNTIPVWARKSEESTSPPPSPPRSQSPVDRGSTWPKAPKPTFRPLPRNAKERGSIDESRIPSQDYSGPSNFCSFTMPQLWNSSNSDDHQNRRKREKSGTSSEDVPPETEKDRRPSLSNTFAATLGGAFTSLASGTYLGGQSVSAWHDDKDVNEGANEKLEEQGNVNPLSADNEEGNDDEEEEEEEEEEAAIRADHEKDAEKQRVMRQRGIEWDSSFTRNYQLTPGWDSPWHPEARGGNSIEIGGYRYNNFGVGGYFPRADTNRSNGSNKKKRTIGKNGMSILLPRKESQTNGFMTIEWWQHFLLDNPFVPLLFRLINVAFTTATLAIAIRLHIVLKQQGAEDAVGSSPIAAIIFSPPTLVHVGIQIWLEYFSRPIGLWRVGNKLFYTLIELVFICLWSAELSLSFDNYFTSTLVCTTILSPYAGDSGQNLPSSQRLDDPSRKPTICSLQRALIGLVFVSLLAYVVVLSVSLFRIFVRVSRR